jgi:hypothetical protein
MMLLIQRPWGAGATLTKAASSPASTHRARPRLRSTASTTRATSSASSPAQATPSLALWDSRTGAFKLRDDACRLRGAWFPRLSHGLQGDAGGLSLVPKALTVVESRAGAALFSTIEHNKQARKLLISSSVSSACISTVPASTGIEGNPWDCHGADSALVPASPSIETTAAQQKHDDDDNEKSCRINNGVSFGRMFGYFISPASGRTWLLVPARAAPLFL